MDPQLRALLYGHGVRCPDEEGLHLFVEVVLPSSATPRMPEPPFQRTVARPHGAEIIRDEDPIHERPSW